MNSPEKFEEDVTLNFALDEESEGSEAYESLADVFNDGLEKIEFPDTIDENNCMQIFDGVFPNGLSPDMFKNGTSITKIEQ